MANKHEVQGEGVVVGVLRVPLTDIIVDEKFNARKDYGGEVPGTKSEERRQTLEELAESLKNDGQLQPVLVSKTDKGKYTLRFGFRRYKALQLLEEEFILVQLWEGTDYDAVMINLTENCSRNDLHPWEMALRCAEISKQFKVEALEISKRVGKSKSHVNNLIRIANNVDSKIFEAWQRNDQRATFGHMVDLAKMDKKAQQAKWAEWGGEKPDGDSASGGDGAGATAGTAGEKKKRPTKRQIEQAFDALKNYEDGEWKKGCVAALKFVMGTAKTIPNVYNPNKPPAATVEAEK